VFTFFALAAVTKFSSDGSILHKTNPQGHYPRGARRIYFIFGKTLDKGFISYVPCNERAKRFKGHGTEVFSTPGAHCNGTGSHFFIAYDEKERQLLHRMLAYFIRDFLITEV